MADASFLQTSFLGGEFAQYMQGRVDEAQYKVGLNVCYNALPIEEGAWVRRPGTQFAGFSRRGAQGRLIGFDVVASTPYDLELTPGWMRLWNGTSLVYDQTGATVSSISTANPAVLTMGSAQTWSTGDTIVLTLGQDLNYRADAWLRNRQFVVTKVDTTHFSIADQLGNTIDGSQFALGSTTCTANHVLEIATPWSTVTTINTVRIAQSEYQILMFAYQTATQLFIAGNANTLVPAPFIDGPYLDPPKDGSSVQASGTSGSVTLTFSTSQGFTAANIGQMVRLLSEPPNWVAGTAYSPGDKTKYNGVYYNCIVSTGTYNPPDTTPASQAICPSAAQWCYAVITGVTNGTTVTATLHEIPNPPSPSIVITLGAPLLYTHDSSNPITTYQMGLYWGTQWPTRGTFHEGRFWFAGAVQNRVDSGMANNGLTCSPTFYDGTVADDCGISAIFNFPEVMQINWMMPTQEGIICGCQSGEVLIQASQLGDPLTPTSMQAHQVTRYGCQGVDPIQVGFSTLFVERYGKKVLDLSPNVFSRRIGAANVSLTARHLTYPGVLEIRWQRELAPVLWATVPNGEGNWIGMTYKREDSYATSGPLFAGWHRHQHGNPGRYPVSIATGTVPGGATDTLAMMSNNASVIFPDYNIAHIEFLTPIFQEGQSAVCAWQLDNAVVPVSANVIYSGGSPISVQLFGFWHGIGKTISAYVGGLDCGDYVVASDGSITVPFAPANTFQPLFTFAWLQSVTSTCNAVSFIGGAPYSDPVFLTHPAVQSYVDTTYGAVDPTTAVNPSGTVFTYTDYVQQGASFDFATGAEIAGVPFSSLGVSGNVEGGNYYIGDDGLVWLQSQTAASPYALVALDFGSSPALVVAWGSGRGGIPNAMNQSTSMVTVAIGTDTQYVVAGSFPSGFGNGDVCVYRADRSGKAGFWGHAYNIDGGATSVCAGPQAASSATAFWTNQPFSLYGTTYNFGKTVIAAGSENYDPATWPTPNGDITSTTIRSYAPTDFDASWTAFTHFGGPAYDQTDGNVLIQVSGSGGGSANYIAKLSATDGSVLWKVAIGNSAGFDDQAVTRSRIQAGTYYFWEHTSLWGGTCHAIETSTGTDHTQTFSGIGIINGQVSDDALGSIMGGVGWDSAQGPLTLLNSTATSGATTGVVYFADGQQPQTALVATAPSVIGYRYYSKGQLLRKQEPQEDGARNGPGMGKRRRNHQAAFYFVQAIEGSVSIGTDFTTMFPLSFTDNGESRTALQPFTGIKRETINDDYTYDGMIAWQTNSAYPLTVAAIEGFVETQDV